MGRDVTSRDRRIEKRSRSRNPLEPLKWREIMQRRDSSSLTFGDYFVEHRRTSVDEKKEQQWIDLDVADLRDEWGGDESLITDWFADGDSEDFIDRLEAENQSDGRNDEQPWKRAVSWVRSLTDNA